MNTEQGTTILNAVCGMAETLAGRVSDGEATVLEIRTYCSLLLTIQSLCDVWQVYVNGPTPSSPGVEPEPEDDGPSPFEMN